MYDLMKNRILSAVSIAALMGLNSPALATEPGANIVSGEILPGWKTPDGTEMVGLKLVLAPGWKTYWRAPGDAGVPPRFNWEGSANVAKATLLWPRPEVYYQNDMRTIGYKHEVIFPVELTPTEANQPMRLSAHISLGVCQDICMPMELALNAKLPAKAQSAPIRAALAALPETASAAGVGAVTCTTEPIDDGLRLTAHVSVKPIGAREVAVVEMSDPGIWVSESAISRSGDELTAVTDLVPTDAAPFKLNGDEVRITLLSGGNAIDIQGCKTR